MPRCLIEVRPGWQRGRSGPSDTLRSPDEGRVESHPLPTLDSPALLHFDWLGWTEGNRGLDRGHALRFGFEAAAVVRRPVVRGASED